MTSDFDKLVYEHPEDYNFVSKKHYQRKLNVVQGNSPVSGIFGRAGPIAGVVFFVFDTAVVFCLKLLFMVIRIASNAFDFVLNYAFKNFGGFFPTVNKNSKVISSKFIRYVLTVFLPPLGIVMGKGIYGWFSVLVCVILTYINYVAGIIYAFVITSRNRYADQFEQWEINDLRKKTIQPSIKEIEDDSAFYTILFMFISLPIIFFVIIANF